MGGPLGSFTRTLQVRISPDQWDWLFEESRKAGVSVAEIIRTLVDFGRQKRTRAETVWKASRELRARRER